MPQGGRRTMPASRDETRRIARSRRRAGRKACRMPADTARAASSASSASRGLTWNRASQRRRPRAEPGAATSPGRRNRRCAARRRPAATAAPGQALPASPGSSTGCRKRRCARTRGTPNSRAGSKPVASARASCDALARAPPASRPGGPCPASRPRCRCRRSGRRARHARGQHEVARRCRSRFEHPAARRRRQPCDQPVAAQQVIFAGEVVDMALAPVDPVHQMRRGEIARPSQAAQDVEVEAAIDRRAVARGEADARPAPRSASARAGQDRAGRAAARARRRCGRSRARRAVRCA